MTVQIKKSSALTSLSMTPLIDIVFLLLIFFLVATRFAEEDREVDVSLPSASEAKPLIEKPREIQVSITPDGKFFLAGRPMDKKELESALVQAVSDNPVGQSVILRADKKCSWEEVMSAIDTCHRAGVKDVRPAAGVVQ